jgi:hypothetical protein
MTVLAVAEFRRLSAVCVYCGESFDDGPRKRTADHVVPHAFLNEPFPSDDKLPVVDACRFCNNRLFSPVEDRIRNRLLVVRVRSWARGGDGRRLELPGATRQRGDRCYGTVSCASVDSLLARACLRSGNRK